VIGSFSCALHGVTQLLYTHTHTQTCPLCCVAVCIGAPSARVTNAVFNSSCASTPAGSVCYGRCNAGYGGPSPPTVVCEANDTSPTGAYWATTAGEACDRGEAGGMAVVAVVAVVAARPGLWNG